MRSDLVPRPCILLLGLVLLLPLLCFSRATSGELQQVEDFGSNPGMIDMYTYIPKQVQPGAALVVSLHGCHQDAATYSGNGWKDLAEKWNILLLYPEQSQSNNPLGCWNWFRAEDIGDWPSLSIWHGSEDTRVAPQAQQELLEQWTALHGIDTEPELTERLGPGMKAMHREYEDQEGTALVETYRIHGMGHALPIAAHAEQECGKEGEYISDKGICAMRHIGRFWGLDR